MNSSANADDIVQLHELHLARLTTDDEGIIYDKKVLSTLCPGSIVRISMYTVEHIKGRWSHDSPYVKIAQVLAPDEDGVRHFLGVVLPWTRSIECNKYIIATGDLLTFYEDNVIEIPRQCSEDISDDVKNTLAQYLTDTRVSVTGPLYTISAESDTDSDSDASYSDSESETDASGTDASE